MLMIHFKYITIIVDAKQEAVQASTEIKQAKMQLSFCQKQLGEKKRAKRTSSSSYEKDKANLQNIEKEVAAIQVNKLIY